MKHRNRQLRSTAPPSGTARHRGRPWGALALACLPSCSLFSSTPTATFERSGPLAVEAAAWVLARACRLEYVGVDPRPDCAHAPVVRTSATEFMVRYVRDPDGVFRVYCNGRITAPCATLVQPMPVALDGCRFVPQQHSTGQAGAATADELRVTISAATDGGSRVRIDLYGTPASTGLGARLDQSLTAATAMVRSGSLLARGAARQADLIATRALAALAADWQPGVGLFAARLRVVRALAAEARGDLAAMRHHLLQALSHDSGLDQARSLLARTLERLADRPGIAAHAAGTAERRRLQRTPALQRARAHLAAGDLAAAANWARRSLDEADDPLPARRLLGQVFAATGKPQRALEQELIVLDSVGFESGLVFRMARLYGRVGNAAAGVRLLSRYHHRLAPQPLRATLRDLIARMPAALAGRIIRGQSADLVRELLAGSLGPACAALYARRDAVRLDLLASMPEDLEDGYRAASGVEPTPTR